MTELLQRAFAAVQKLDAAERERVAEAILSLVGDAEPQAIDPDHLDDVRAGLAEARRGQFASDEEVAAAFRLFGSR